MNTDKLELQSAEFTACDKLVSAYKALPAVVDDAYPEARHNYENALRYFLLACKANGRKDLENKNIPRNSLSHDTFKTLRYVNLTRAMQWHGSDSIPWTGADWSNAMCGEAGETANAVKKMRRLETNVKSNNATQPLEIEHGRNLIAKEIGDTLIYLDLLAAYYHIDLGDTVCKVFNQVSEREGFPERLTLV